MLTKDNEDDDDEKMLIESPQIITDNSNCKKKANNDIMMTTTTTNNCQLSFSVDRLLNTNHKNNLNSKVHCKYNNNNNHNNKDNNSANSNSQMAPVVNQRLIGYECCKNLNHIAEMLNNQRIINLRNNDGSSNSNNGYYGCSNELLKSVVRPTPIRMGNSGNVGLPNHQISPPPPTSSGAGSFNGLQSVLKYQQISSVSMNPINSLKSLQAATIQFRHQSIGVHHHHHQQQNHHHGDNITAIDNINSRIGNNSAANINRNHSGAIHQQQQTNNGGSSQSSASSKRKRSWSRAVFSNLQRKGLEIQFQQQKYITKPDRRKLANRLNLTDAQVKVWFQNRRMKWRHNLENLKSGQEKQPIDGRPSSTNNDEIDEGKTSSEDEIDVVAE